MNKQRIYLFIPIVVFAALVVLFYRGMQSDPNAMPSALLNKSMPAFNLPRLDNPQEMRNEKIFLGKVTLLNVWATWCETCRVEHPFLNQLKMQGVNIIGIDYKDDPQSAQRWIAQLGNPYNDVIVDEEGRLGLDLGVFGAPETYLIDKQGVIRYKLIGELNQKNWAEPLPDLDQSLSSLVEQLRKD